MAVLHDRPDASRRHTWDKLPDAMRAGGEPDRGSYDPDLKLTYWGIAQAKPWMPASRGDSV
jgi:alcohol dehydrogenase (cytochrome c)